MTGEDARLRAESRRRLREYYRTSEGYLGHLLAKGAEDFRPYLDLVRRFIPPGARLLDLGCGSGASTALLEGMGYRVLGVDLSPLFLERGRAAAGGGPPRLCAAEGTALPAAEGAFDAVCAYEFIEHVPDVAEVLAEMWRAVRPGGHVVIVSPNLRSPLMALSDMAGMLAGRRAGRPPFYTGLGGAAAFFAVSLAENLGALLRREARFPLRPPQTGPEADGGGDFDGVYRASQIDLAKYLKGRGGEVRNLAFGRSRAGRWAARWLPWFAGGLGVVVRKPGGRRE